jgi:hypothetical protein
MPLNTMLLGCIFFRCLVILPMKRKKMQPRSMVLSGMNILYSVMVRGISNNMLQQLPKFTNPFRPKRLYWCIVLRGRNEPVAWSRVIEFSCRENR